MTLMHDRVEKGFYSNRVWDEDAWVKVISVEYEQLTQRYPFGEKFQSLAPKGKLRLLDVGSGTGIFPSYLDKLLPADLHFVTDFLDVAEASLQLSEMRFQNLVHFQAARAIHGRIEDIPKILPDQRYDVIWAIHSFTTVEIERMPDVFQRLIELLAPSGFLFFYQLTSRAAYQDLHDFYRTNHPNGRNAHPFMQYEDSVRILDDLGHSLETHEFFFDHSVDASDPELLEKYLQKCVLDDSLKTVEFFSPLLSRYLDRSTGVYRFPQSVNFGVLRALN
ncbi:MAG: class I SAM-dependent methyltransferase [Anaerolineales bacterium]